MIRRPSRSTSTDTLFPSTTIFRSRVASGDVVDSVDLTADLADGSADGIGNARMVWPQHFGHAAGPVGHEHRAASDKDHRNVLRRGFYAVDGIIDQPGAGLPCLGGEIFRQAGHARGVAERCLSAGDRTVAGGQDRKSTRLNSSHYSAARKPSSA